MARRTALLVDTPSRWIRRPNDALGALLCVLGIAGVLLLSVYASSTTLAVTADVRHAADGILQTVLALPINVLVGILTFFAPLAVLVELLLTQRWRAVATSLVAVGVAAILSNLSVWLLREYFPDANLTTMLSVAVEGQAFLLMFPYVAVLAALCTAAGPSQTLVSVRWTWPLFWVVVVLSILQGQQTLPGALATAFLGMAVGQFMRYVIGVDPTRATGIVLVRLIRRSGVDATEIVRVGDVDPDDLAAWRISTTSPVGYHENFKVSQVRAIISRAFDPIEDRDLDEATESLAHETLVDPIAVYADYQSFDVPQADTISRDYIAIDADGLAHHISVLDGDRHILGVISTIWAKIRLKVQLRKSDTSIHDTADQVTLMNLAAQHAGVVVPDLVGVASSDDSVLIATKIMRAPTLSSVLETELTDDVLDQVWVLLSRAHSVGLAHRNLHAGVLLLDQGDVLITNWHDGTIASSEVARRIDLAQALSMLTALVGADRAIASFERNLGEAQLLATSPILQASIMPRQTLASLSRKELSALRTSVADRIPPTEEAGPVEVRRFSPKTVVSVSVAVFALYVLLGTINFTDLWAALREANVVMLAFAALASGATYLGAALHLKAYTPEKLPLGQTTIVQMAAKIITLVVPAGIGPAALNLRYLNTKRVPTALGLATVSLVQIAQFVTTVILLVVVALLAGDIGSLTLPSAKSVIITGTIVAAIGLLFIIKPIRAWLVKIVRPTFEKVWPRVVWLANHPERIALGAVGSLIQSVGFVATFGFALASLGYSLPVVTLALTFLISNTVGSVVPSPGGIGPVEAALTGGLAVAGIPYSVALSTAVIYRLLTFWGPVPFGWFALRYLQKRDLA